MLSGLGPLHTWGLKACDHCILRSLIGHRRGDRPSSPHTIWWRAKGSKKSSWIKMSTWKTTNNVSWCVGTWVLKEIGMTQIIANPINGTTFRWESKDLTTTWSRPLACVWSDPYFIRRWIRSHRRHWSLQLVSFLPMNRENSLQHYFV